MVHSYHFFPISILIFLSVAGCSDSNNSYDSLKNSLTFYASFDGSLNADLAAGDPNFYTAPSWDERLEFDPFSEADEDYFDVREGEGKHGDALWIDSRHEPVFYYRGEDNISYESNNWSGTVSFWLRLAPDADLYPGYSDPIQITASAWNDGALFVDFTDVDPRIFRFAIFADREVWDPKKLDWNDISVEQRPMLEIENPPFSREIWTHIAFSFENFNTGEENGTVYCYLNGEKVGELKNRVQTFTWDSTELFIWLGYNYRGYFDDLSIFNRTLTDEEIRQIYNFEEGIHEIADTR